MEYTECLHIDLTKDAYCTTISKDEYLQMTTWLDQCECILLHDKYIQWQLDMIPLQTPNSLVPPQLPPLKSPSLVFPHELKMSKWPTVYGVTIDMISEKYRPSFFKPALACFIIHLQHPEFNRCQVNAAAETFHLHF